MKQQFVVQLSAQESFAEDQVQNLQRRGSHQSLRRVRGPSLRGIHPVKVAARAAPCLVQKVFDAALPVTLRTRDSKET